MDLVDFIWHLVGFVLPALALAPAVVLIGRFLGLKSPSARSLQAQLAINFAVCVAVLMLGLALLGKDGRMLTYGALVLASAAAEAWRPARG